MKTLKMTAVATALVASFAASESVLAEVSGNVALTSNYVWRGVTQNAEDPSIQGGFDYAADSGFYAGIWGASVDFGGDEGTEIDLYAGYGFSAGGVDLDLGIIAYTYHGGDAAGGDFEEIYLGASFGDFGVTFSAGLDDAPNNIEASYSFDLGGAAVTLTAGDYEDAWSYYSVGVSGEAAGLGWDVTFSDADPDVGELDSQVALTLSKSL